MHLDVRHLVSRLVLVVMLVAMLSLPSLAAAQGQDVVLLGRVQWIAAQKMMLLPQSGSVPVNIDLNQVRLDQYALLAQGNRVAVDGVVSHDGRRVIATSVVLLAGVRD